MRDDMTEGPNSRFSYMILSFPSRGVAVAWNGGFVFCVLDFLATEDRVYMSCIKASADIVFFVTVQLYSVFL
jgi:hypothetical protein